MSFSFFLFHRSSPSSLPRSILSRSAPSLAITIHLRHQHCLHLSLDLADLLFLSAVQLPLFVISFSLLAVPLFPASFLSLVVARSVSPSTLNLQPWVIDLRAWWFLNVDLTPYLVLLLCSI